MQATIEEVRLATELELTYQQTMRRHSGFLPEITPVQTLPVAFAHLFDAANLLPAYYNAEAGGARAMLDKKLSTFDEALLIEIDKLELHQLFKLNSLLSILFQTYRWDYVPPQKVNYGITHLDFPDGLLAPFKYVCRKLEVATCGTFWSTMLYNWKIKGKGEGKPYETDEIQFSNLEVLHNWLLPPMDEQLARWTLLMVETEGKGGPVINSLVQLIKAAAHENREEVVSLLRQVYPEMRLAIGVFNRELQFKKIDPLHWREWLQPTNICGLDMGDGFGRLEGASGLQIGIVQAIDTALGFDTESVMGAMALESRKYLPKHHRDFLAALEKCRPILRNFILSRQDTEMRDLYNKCVSLMEAFRVSHQVRGAVYLRGDNTPKEITSTGLSMKSESDPVEIYVQTMQERISETNSSLLH